MVAIVHNGNSLRNALHYNENKVKKSVAECIHSMHFPKDTEWLSFKDKISRLEKLTTLNQQTKINSVHISLNFDSSDKLNKEKLKAIADTYMQKIGFGEQPYLVYQHHDAGHSHLHIVTTNITADGSRISLHNLGGDQSMKASKEIEKEFHLIQALSKPRQQQKLKAINVSKAQYGKSETKRAISNVLDAVLPHYKYTSLAELNVVLKQYNVLADRGSEESRIYKNGGLVYRILNEKGEKIGVPIKASVIYNKPTLPFIKAKFVQNNEARQRYKKRVKNIVDLSFVKQPKQDLQTLQQALQKEGIYLQLSRNDAGIVYGLTYVDHQTKCVFNGSDLGKQYSINAVQQRCRIESKLNTGSKQTIQPTPYPQTTLNPVAISAKPLSNVLHSSIKPETEPLPTELRQDKKQKKKKQQQH